MIINSTGATKSDLTEYLGFFQNKLKEVFGDDFTIRKEGVVDNLATASSLLDMLLEDVILYLIKNQNPYTAEGEWQDNLYALIGMMRNFSTYTKVTRTVEGTANLTCAAGSIRFKNTATEDIFELNTAITLDENGKATGSFTAIEIGAVDLPTDAILSVIDAPSGINGVYYSEGNETTIGDDYEDDSEFRSRWLETKSVKSGNTEGGMYASLLPLVNNSTKNLVIRQNRTNSTVDSIPSHSMEIVIKSAESDETIANAIFDNLMDGVGLYGTTDVTVKDISGTDNTVSFTRASSLAIYFNVEVVLKDGFILAQVKESVKKAITDNFDYAMGERIVANDFYQYINAIDGIDYVTTLEVSKNGSNYYQTLTVDYNEYGTVSSSNITVAED